ncbi:MAG: F0F1 ATP synthase subunit B [Planctomycetota bacterium]
MMHSLLLAGGNGLNSLLEVGSGAFVWTIIIFVCSLPFMWKFVFGPITRALEERESGSRNAAAAAEAAREETERLKAAIQDDLDTARREAAKQVADAKARAAEREKELMAAAKDEAEKERARAKAEIDQALNSARELLRKEAVELGVGVAERVIRREFSEADQSRLVEDFQKEANLN